MRVLTAFVVSFVLAFLSGFTPLSTGSVAAESGMAEEDADQKEYRYKRAPSRYLDRVDDRGFFHLTPSLGVPTLMGDATVDDREIGINADAATNLRNIDLGTGLAAEVGYRHTSLLAGLRYYGLATDQIDTGREDAVLNLDKYVTQLAMYRAFEPVEMLQLGPVAGFRYVQLYHGLTNEEGARRASGDSDGWLDPILGVRGRLSIADLLYIPVYADAGGIGFGSEITWKAYGGVGVSVDGVDFEVGYRHLYVDYVSQDLDYAVGLGEPVLKTRFRF